MDVMLLVAQSAAVFFLAAWLTIGVLDNLFFPKLNSTFTAEVLEMARMRDEYPEAYAKVAHRRISKPSIQLFLFRLIVAWELLATIARWIGFAAILASLLGQTNPDTARALALLGALMFTATWAGFLIVGNWFCYWFCHDEAQNTHYQMTLWGVTTMIFLAIA
ncbi:MAG: DUF2165 family protein [Rhodospirillaceae bacterium]|nr:DUF2165 family protein [Rhodospirillaceae bacterium]